MGGSLVRGEYRGRNGNVGRRDTTKFGWGGRTTLLMKQNVGRGKKTIGWTGDCCQGGEKKKEREKCREGYAKKKTKKIEGK